MKWNTHQDMENRAYAGILTTLFPEQTATLPRLLVWSVIFLIELCLVAFAAYTFGLIYNRWLILLLLAAFLAFFRLQGILFHTVRNHLK